MPENVRTPSPALTGTDRQLLALLRQNARRTFSEMAAIIGVSRTTVKERMDRLVSSGRIEQFTIRVAEEQHGETGIRAFFHLQLHRPVCPTVFGCIEGWPELVGCWSISGDIDMTVLIDCPNHCEIERLRDRLACHPEVRRLTTSVVLRQWRSRGESALAHEHAPAL